CTGAISTRSKGKLAAASAHGAASTSSARAIERCAVWRRRTRVRQSFRSAAENAKLSPLLFSPQHLPHLTVFAQLVRQRSFTRAARVLGVSKSFVSTQIRALEESLGMRLVERTTRSFALTQ